jgi:hypothetical protein
LAKKKSRVSKIDLLFYETGLFKWQTWGEKTEEISLSD